MQETLHDFCVKTQNQVLLSQWDKERNSPLTPAQLSYGSKRKVWWRCEKGHSWQAAVYTRTGGGTGCPYCSGRRTLAGVTDLATRYPELARQWHPSKNGSLTPAQVSPGSHRAAWWICGKGHVWRAQVKSRAAGSGCPVCANRKIVARDNDLAAHYPELERQWHPTKNGMLLPTQVPPGSRRKVWWRCEKGHAWQATVYSRVSGGNGCPYCAGRRVLPGENDLASRYPAVAAQWHPSRNRPLTPQQVTSASNRKVWWQCRLGHAYEAAVASRTLRGSGCPYCAGRKVLVGFNDLSTLEPTVAAQWHPTLNGDLTPEMVTAGSRRKVWWQCPEGHSWKAAVYARAGQQKSGCPVCAGTVRKQRPYSETTSYQAAETRV